MTDTLLPSSVFSLLAQARARLRDAHTLIMVVDSILTVDQQQDLARWLRADGCQDRSCSDGAEFRRSLVAQLGAMIEADMMLQRDLAAKKVMQKLAGGPAAPPTLVVGQR